MNPEDYIEPVQLVHRQVYRIDSRNILVGVWNAEYGGFIGIREKFGSTYLDVEYEYDLRNGTARGIELLDLVIPENVSLKLYLGTVDSNDGRPVEFVENLEIPGPPVRGAWHYADDGTVCVTPSPVALANKELYALLEPLDFIQKEERKRLHQEEAKKFGWDA